MRHFKDTKQGFEEAINYISSIDAWDVLEDETNRQKVLAAANDLWDIDKVLNQEDGNQVK